MLTRTCLSLLLASTAMTAISAVAEAQSAHTGRAAVASDGKSAAGGNDAESVTVTGRSARQRSPGGGLMRIETAPKAVQTVTRDFIAKQSPTTNGQQLLKMLPSANVSDADPFGLWSGQSIIRGLSSSQVGWLLDGAPLNDIGGGQFYANEVLEAEDLDSVSLQPGSVNLDAPVVNASAGLVNFTMKDPAYRPGGLFDLSFGSYKAQREFLRLDSGDIRNTGIRAMFAFSYTHANAWRGPGGAAKKHYDFKLVKDWNNGSHVGLTVSYNSQVNSNYNYPTANQYNGSGYNNTVNPMNYVVNGNSNSFAATYAGVNSNGANFYQLRQNPFENVVASAPSTLVINSRLKIDDTPYFWHGVGNGTGASLLTENAGPGRAGGTATNPVGTFYGNRLVNLDLNGDGRINRGQAIALTPSNQEQFRPGNTVKVSYDLDRHNQLTAGWWYEYSNLLQYSPVSLVNQQTGISGDIWGKHYTYLLPNGQPYYTRNFLTLTQVNMLFIGDHAKYFDDHLTVDAGFKEAMVTRRTYNYIPGTTYNRNINDAQPLPQLGISWQFNKRHQIYVTGSTNFRTPSNTSLVDYISGTSGLFTQRGGDSRSEYSISEEVGYRYNGDFLVGSISFFNYNFTNRQIGLNFLDAGGAPFSQTVNAGGQTSRGVDVQVSTLPILYHLRPYATFEYLDARIDNNLQATGTLRGKSVVDYLPTTGKVAVQSPHVQAGLGLDYDDGHLFGGVDLKYVGQQYSTFMNDEKMPDYVTNSVYGGYRFHRYGVLKAPQIQLNLLNLTGATFRNGVYTVQNNARPTKGVFGSTIAASTPAYYLQPGFAAICTLSTAF
ncbi:TonB-dependent receptor [Rhizosaccharibacter radicis]|uniref:TonB-dependent receptor n=1 Tax=Rhizosaccharibacter radicis TaxID=2782605 RepID=A0ABT1VV59_9PROT|nr:TonB-dependent receptor [Acetobacteraceae bacterium KSS12]